MKWCPGTLLEVRSAAEIMGTLDAQGTLHGLPFMPEMLAFCGHRFRVFRRVEKTCAEGSNGVLRMRAFDSEDVLLLNGVRCDGNAHDGCQRACMLFWHAAWLKSPSAGTPDTEPFPTPDQGTPSAERLLPTAAARLPTRSPAGTYICQSTQLWQATRPLSRSGRALVVVRDILASTYSPLSMLRFLLVPIGLNIVKRIGVASQVRGWQAKTPDHELGLQAGDRVRVKSKEEIAATLDRGGRNRGLEFTPLMHHCCGRVFTVKQRVERIILEASGEMRELRNTVMLEGSTCDGRVFFGGCPRNELHFWREAWLERLEQPDPSLAKQSGGR